MNTKPRQICAAPSCPKLLILIPTHIYLGTGAPLVISGAGSSAADPAGTCPARTRLPSAAGAGSERKPGKSGGMGERWEYITI